MRTDREGCERYFQIMQGTNPDGSHYADPVYFVSYFNGGDAVGHLSRGGYGYNQSLGCVELPLGRREEGLRRKPAIGRLNRWSAVCGEDVYGMCRDRFARTC